MKKTTKLIAMLTVIALLATMAATALADDKLYQEEEVAEPEPEEVFEDEPEEKTTEGKTQRKVLIKSSRGDTVVEGEIITLKSKLVGFDDVEVQYQWQVDRGDGEGWVDVEGATGPEHSFVARKDTILYSWRLTISTDE